LADARKVIPPEFTMPANGVNIPPGAFKQYITTDYPWSVSNLDNRVITKDIFQKVIDGPMYIYVYGIVEYENLVTRVNKQYRFMFKYKPPPANPIEFEFIINDNSALK